MFVMTSHGRYLLFAPLLLSLFLAFVYFEIKPSHIIPIPSHGEKSGHSSSNNDATTVQQVLQFIYNPGKFSLTTPSFAHNGETYKLPSKPVYTSPLGKDICILDVDTRPFNGKSQMFSSGEFDWSDVDAHSGGIMNHYMYAKTHGYDYKFYKASNTEGQHPTWVKVAALANTLKKYKYVVFLDADAIFNQMHIPMEWMMNYWSINSTTSLAMALDPPEKVNQDKNGRLYSNTGFIIAQNNEKTFEILKAWEECPSDTRYKGCSEWNKVRFHEQSAYGSYVRYDYEDYLKELPCNEANGEWDLETCKGVFIQHMWWRTNTVRSYFGDKTLQSLMGKMHTDVMWDIGNIVETSAGNKAVS